MAARSRTDVVARLIDEFQLEHVMFEATWKTAWT